LRAGDIPPVVLVLALMALALIWNGFAGLRFNISLAVIMAGPVVCFAAAMFYTRVRPEPSIAEIALYMGLWLLYPAFGAELTYLATTLNFPLRDGMFMAWDRALGFNWMGWGRFVLAHPLAKAVQDAAYSSCFWQPLAAIPIFAIWGPRGRNGEFLTSVMVGLVITIAVYGLLPNIGPADFQHLPATGRIIETLRSGFKGPYTYVGVVPFPSFHTVMAILFTVAHRDNRVRLLAFGALNLVMLSAVPFQGDHYLSDMIAGAGIATISFFAARRMYRARPVIEAGLL
jgi:hypothetical protein